MDAISIQSVAEYNTVKEQLRKSEKNVLLIGSEPVTKTKY